MMHVLAPKASWGCSRVMLATLLVGLAPVAVDAQPGATPKAGAAPNAGATPKAGAAPKAAEPTQGAPAVEIPADLTPEQQEEAGLVDTENLKKNTRVETFKDPRAEGLLPIEKFKELPSARVSPNIDREINAMAAGQGRLDANLLKDFVAAQAARLTDHDNLKALLAPDPNIVPTASVMREFDRGGESLLEPLRISDASKNTGFRQAYDRQLIAQLQPLLNQHLLTRIEAMIVLGTSGSPEAMGLFTAQFSDPNQVDMVKLWAARGVTNVAQGGRREVEIASGNAASKALSDYLQQPDIPWPVRVRVLEALGSLRNAGQNGAEHATAAMMVLADAGARPNVRAWAAWALGMMKVPVQVPQYNYALVADAVGHLAVELGTQINDSFTESPDLSRRLTGLLAYQILPSFRGENGVRESGLLNAGGLGQAGKGVNEIATLVQSIAVAALNLTSAATPRPDQPQWQKQLATRVAALRDYLNNNPPASRKLVPDGPDIPGPQAPQVASGAEQ